MSGQADLINKLLDKIGTIPGAKVNRIEYLEGCFNAEKRDILYKIINEGTLNAGVSINVVKRLAEDAIKHEKTNAAATSYVSGITGWATMLPSVSADVIQYYVHCFRLIQKMMYLYGWNEDIINDSGDMDSEIRELVILYLGIIFGIEESGETLMKIASVSTSQVAKGAMTKEILDEVAEHTFFSEGVEKTTEKLGRKFATKGGIKTLIQTIPAIGATASAVVTYATFVPGVTKLKVYMETGIVN